MNCAHKKERCTLYRLICFFFSQSDNIFALVTQIFIVLLVVLSAFLALILSFFTCFRFIQSIIVLWQLDYFLGIVIENNEMHFHKNTVSSLSHISR